MIEVYDIDNKLIKGEMLFTFDRDNKKFIVYKDINDEILASYYKDCDGKRVIMPINDDRDYDVVDMELEKWWNLSE